MELSFSLFVAQPGQARNRVFKKTRLLHGDILAYNKDTGSLKILRVTKKNPCCSMLFISSNGEKEAVNAFPVGKISGAEFKEWAIKFIAQNKMQAAEIKQEQLLDKIDAWWAFEAH